MQLIDIWTAISGSPALAGAAEPLPSEGPAKLLVANALIPIAGVGTVYCSPDDGLVQRHGLERQDQLVGRFGTFDLAFEPAAGRSALLEVKYARSSPGRTTGTLPNWTFFLFLYDIIATWLERLERNRQPDAFGIALVRTQDFHHEYSEGGRNFDSPWKQAFPLAAGQQAGALRLSPSLARDNPGTGRRAAPRLAVPATLTRKHVSVAMTGAMNAKLVGLFERPAFSMHLTYEYFAAELGVAGADGTRPHVLICVRPTDLFVRQDGVPDVRLLPELLPFVP